MNIAIIGLGYWGKHYVRIVNNSNHNLTAICDLNEKMLKKYEHIKTNFYTNYLDMFNKENLDAVIIVTIAKTHLQIIKDALKYNLKIFVEKPYTLNNSECLEIQNLLNNDTKIMIGHTYLYNSKINYIKEFIKKDFNNVKSISFQWTCYGPIRLDTTPIFDLAVHPISILFYLFPNKNISNVNSIKSSSGNSYFVNFKLDDIIVQMNISWANPGKIRTMTINDENTKLIFDDVSNKEPVRILYLNNPNYNTNTQTLVHSDGNILIPQIENKEPLTSQFNDWIKYINGEKECYSNHEFSTNIIRLCEGLQ